MKTFVKSLASWFIAFAALLGTTSCKEEHLRPEPTTHSAAREAVGDLTNHHFDAQTMAAKIEARLLGKVPGFGYCIVVNGQVAAANGVGKARYSVDAPERNYSENVIQDIGSCTKYFAALLAMKTLDATGQPINTALEKKVYLYLPYYFVPSNDFKKVTFRDLMAHTSGIINNGSSLGGIEKTVENGINETTDPAPLASPKPFGQYDYQNINYVLLRYCTVYLAATQNPTLANELKIMENALKAAIAYEGTENAASVVAAKNSLNLKICTWYQKLLREQVFQPAGLAQWNQVEFDAWGVADNQKVKYYKTVNSNVAGYDSGNHLTDAAGAGGLKLSAMHMAQVMTYARANIIVPADVMAKMKVGDGKGNQMGFDDAYTRPHGLYFHKNGSGAGNAVLFDFDGPGVNVQLVITANTTGTEVINTAVWADLFDQSWK
ncbi:MAG: serine hydrolase domain-containing protein [Spirosomataceae bacterium]